MAVKKEDMTLTMILNPSLMIVVVIILNAAIIAANQSLDISKETVATIGITISTLILAIPSLIATTTNCS